jgi:protein involved in polysaccharide export with SLBB domain
MNKAASLWMAVVAVSLAGVCLRAASEKGPSKRSDHPTAEAASGSPSSNSPLGQFQEREPRYQVGKSDVLEINFPFTPELNQTVTVQPDGFVALRGVADLHVAGLTVPEVRESLKKAYSKILRDPALTVDLKDFEKPYFTAFGQVVRPGKYDLRGETTLTQAVAIAGGFRDGAKPSHVLLFHRISSEWTEVKKIDVKHLLRKGDLREDLRLQPGDILFVPKSFSGKLGRFIPNANVGAVITPY